MERNGTDVTADNIKNYPPALGQRAVHINSEYGIAAALEAQRLADKYGKDFLDCDDLIKIMGVGKNNIRLLLNSEDFPTIEIGNRKVVSVIAFSIWSMKSRDL